MRTRLLIVLTLLLVTAIVQAQDNTNLSIHVVQRGENLFRIALSYGLSTEELAHLNGITDPNSIQVGQRLLVPAHGSVMPQVHTVQPGETLQTIGTLYGLTVDELATLNNLPDPDSLYIGQVLNIAAPAAGSSDLPASAPLIVSDAAAPPQPDTSVRSTAGQQPTTVIHSVLPGETVFRIATSYGTTVNELVQANSLSDPEVIYAGQTLVIQNVIPPQLAIDLPAPITGLEVMPLVLIEGQTGRFRMTASVPVSVSGAFLNSALSFAAEMDSTRSTALVGVPVGTPAGVYPLALTVTDGAGAQIPISANLQIVSGGYMLETDIALIADRVNLLDPVVEDAEQNALRGVMSRFNPERYFNGVMGLPAAATVTSAFGNTRSYNAGSVHRVHAGTDFGGAPGTPIFAPAPGRVVLTDTLNVRGVATVIDHGWGVYTGYWHQTERHVQLGETVSTGQVIGTMGATGRVSGPHLHWEMWVNGVPVDPMQWVILAF
jgi:murein DD-endopeptidase MepM/ murein hydrolase activator NlpD